MIKLGRGRISNGSNRMPSIGSQRGILHPSLAEQTHSGSGSGETGPKTPAPDRTIRSGLPILNDQEGMSVDPSEPIEGQRGSFTNAFSPRVLGMHFSQVDTNQNGYSFEVRISHFDLLSGRFRESDSPGSAGSRPRQKDRATSNRRSRFSEIPKTVLQGTNFRLFLCF